jgi:predicted Zn-dependent protease
MANNEAIDRCRNLIEKFPDNELARFSLGKAYYDAGEYQSAKEQFQVALMRKPDWMVVQILLGRCELALGNHESSINALKRARQLAIEQDHQGPLAEVEQLLRELAAPSP